MERRPLRRARAAPQSGLHEHRGAHAGARHRCDDGGVHDGRWGAAVAAPVPRVRPAGVDPAPRSRRAGRASGIHGALPALRRAGQVDRIDLPQPGGRLQPGRRRRGAGARGGAGGHAQLLRGARGSARARPRVHRGGRRTRRRVQRDPVARAVAARVRRGSGRARAIGRTQRCDAHDRRRDAGGLRVPDADRGGVRAARDQSDHRADRELLGAGGCASGPGCVRRGPARRDGRADRAAWRALPGRRASGVPRRGGAQVGRASAQGVDRRRNQPHALDPARNGRVRAADRVRERREPVPGAGRREAPRARAARRGRGKPRGSPASVLVRELGARARGRRRRGGRWRLPPSGSPPRWRRATSRA